jgi:lipopolysaccharide/colanic/teichoic acid biosynthesis glycosyltransferase
MTKRLFDIIFSLMGMVITVPLSLIIVCAIKLSSPGPVFYKGERIGKGGRPFKILKFRTMVVGAEKLGGPSVAENDSRVTKAGKILRKYKLDEIPQLINIFKGEMSFVGPRPEVKYYVDMFTEKEKKILTVRPGMTDLASLWNFDEGSLLAASLDPEKIYAEKVRPRKIELQLEYVDNRSFLTDVKIILRTIFMIFLRKKPAAVEEFKNDKINGPERNKF